MPQKYIPNKHYIFAADPLRHKYGNPASICNILVSFSGIFTSDLLFLC